MKRKQSRTKIQYSKSWMTKWQNFVMFWLSVFFVEDIFLNQGSHLETLCITLVTSIAATLIPYFCKSYFETKQEKLMEYYEKEGTEDEEQIDE